MAYIPFLTSQEIEALKGESAIASFQVLWAARLTFPGKEGVKEALVAWCRRGYQVQSETPWINYSTAWRCSLCGEQMQEDCLHSRTARQLLISEIRSEARNLFPAREENAAWAAEPWFFEPAVAAEVIWWLWNLIEKDERCVGQIRQRTTWIMTIDEVLDMKPSDETFKEAFKLLAEQKRLLLDGTIVCSYEEKMKEYVALEKSTGHKELHRSDFGSWACHYCRIYGDEYGPGPHDIPCVREESTMDNGWTQAEDSNDG